MKKTVKLLGSIVLVAVFGFAMTACTEEELYTDPFSGTWVATNDGTIIKLVAVESSHLPKSGTFSQYMNGREALRGTYTYSGNTVTAVMTLVNQAMFGVGTSTWIDYANADSSIKNNVPATTRMTITNNTFTANGVTFSVPPRLDGQWFLSAEGGTVNLECLFGEDTIEISLNSSNYQKGILAFSSDMIYVKITHEWVDTAWVGVEWDEDLTFAYTLTGNTLSGNVGDATLTLSNGLVDGHSPTGDTDLSLFEGTWTRTPQ